MTEFTDEQCVALMAWWKSLTLEQLFFLKDTYEVFLKAQSYESQGSEYLQ